jgi:hypothetical protein
VILLCLVNEFKKRKKGNNEMRSTLKLLAVGFAAAIVIAFAQVGASAQTKIPFNQNVSGTASRAQPKKFVFTAKAGQSVQITLDSESAMAMKISVASNATGKAVADESEGDMADMSEQTFSATLADAGDYTITITSSAAESAAFQLKVTAK